VVFGKVAELGKNTASVGFAFVVDEPTRREWHEDHADTEDERRDELQAEGKQPSSFLLATARASNVVRAVVDPETDHDAEGDGELLKTNESTADFRRSDLGIVHGNDHRERTDTHTSDETTGENRAVASRDGSCLDDDSEDENADVHKNGILS